MQQRYLKEGGTIALIVILAMTPPLSTDLYLSALPTVAVEFGTTQSLVSLTITLFFLFMAVGMLVLGSLSDKYGRRPVLIVSAVVSLLASAACAGVQGIGAMVVLRMLNGLGAGGLVAIGTALVKDCFDGARMSTILSLTQAISMFAPMVAPLLGVGILELGGWRVEFVALAVLMAVSLLGSLLLQETLPAGRRVRGSLLATFAGLLSFLRNATFVRVLCVGGLMSSPYMAYLSVASFAFISWFGVSTGVFGVLFALASAAAVIGPFMYLRTAGVRTRSAVALVLGLGLACSVIMLVAGHGTLVAFMVSIMLFIFASTYTRPLVTTLLLRETTSNVGAAASLINFVFTAIGCVGMLLTSLNWPDCITGLGCIMAGSVLLACLLWGIQQARRPFRD